jgi:hypothetical protein
MAPGVTRRPGAGSAVDATPGNDREDVRGAGRSSLAASALPRTTRQLTPAPGPPTRSSLVIPDATHPARTGADGEQVVQTGAITTPGSATASGHKAWHTRAAIAESISATTPAITCMSI